MKYPPGSRGHSPTDMHIHYRAEQSMEMKKGGKKQSEFYFVLHKPSLASSDSVFPYRVQEQLRSIIGILPITTPFCQKKTSYYIQIHIFKQICLETISKYLLHSSLLIMTSLNVLYIDFYWSRIPIIYRNQIQYGSVMCMEVKNRHEICISDNNCLNCKQKRKRFTTRYR